MPTKTTKGSLKKSAQKKSTWRKKKLEGGSWTCPTFFQTCKFAEGRTWEEANVKYKNVYEQTIENDLTQDFFGYFEDRSEQKQESVTHRGKYQDLQEAATNSCKGSKSQWNLGRCLKDVDEWNETLQALISKVDPSELQGRRKTIALNIAKQNKARAEQELKYERQEREYQEKKKKENDFFDIHNEKVKQLYASLTLDQKARLHKYVGAIKVLNSDSEFTVIKEFGELTLYLMSEKRKVKIYGIYQQKTLIEYVKNKYGSGVSTDVYDEFKQVVYSELY